MKLELPKVGETWLFDKLLDFITSYNNGYMFSKIGSEIVPSFEEVRISKIFSDMMKFNYRKLK